MMGSLLHLALKAGIATSDIAAVERRAPIERRSAEVERLLRELQPFYKWDPEELAMLRTWAAEDPKAVTASLEQSRDLATPEQTQALLEDCHRLINQLAALTGDTTLVEQHREERRRSSLCSLRDARDRLREAVQRAKATAQRQARGAEVAA